MRSTVVAVLGVLSALLAGTATAQSAVNEQSWEPHFSAHVQQLISELTLDEKLTLNSGSKEPVYGGEAGYTAGVPRLEIPAMRWADGQNGINSAYDGTALPASTALAATFDPDLARRAGELLGSEARTMRIDVVLAPFVNISRLSNRDGGFGFGEDPYLAGRMAAQTVSGIQSTGALTMTQQYIANVQGLHQGGGLTGAPGYDFIVDDRTLHEIYLPPFEAAIRAGTTSIMAAYNKVNGDFNAQNQRNLVGILRDELGFEGWTDSDWHANRSTISITRGLDVEMPGSGPMDPFGLPPQFEGKLKAAILAGQIPMSALDRAVGDLLSSMERFGMLDNTRKPPPERIDVEKDAAVARDIATEGAVLVRNEAAILPLKAKSLASLVLIGPTAAQLPSGGGNRAYGFAARLIAPLEALRAEAPSAHVQYALGDPLSGVTIPAEFLHPAAGAGMGLSRDDQDGSPIVNEVVDHTTSTLPAGHTYVWKGTLTVPTGGAYTLEIASWGGAATLTVDGRERGSSGKLAFAHGVPRRWTSVTPTLDNLDHALATLPLQAGKSYALEIEGVSEQNMAMQIRLGWITPEMRRQALDEAVAAAKAADTAVVFVWNGRGGDQNVGELSDSLPNDQDALVEAVAAANPNTVVVLNTGTGVRLPWADHVKAILQMWTPGQEGGWATADLLLGKADPSGRLAMTLPKRLEDSPAMAPGHPERYQGIASKQQVVFSEGTFVGYRWYDAQKIEPLFPFGYGLSYTSFAFNGLKTARSRDGVDVSFTVKNTGRVSGAEVAQVYVGAPARPPVPMAPKSLSGFARVALNPGETKSVTIHVPARQFAYWSTEKQRWITPAASRPIYVGASSRDIRLTRAVAIPARDEQVSSGERPGELALTDMVTGRQTSVLGQSQSSSSAPTARVVP